MNERIEKLAEQAGLKHHNWITNESNVKDGDFKYPRLEDYEKFAELIVRECASRVTTKANVWGDMTGFAIKESILDCANDLKQHFGVEE